MLVWIYYSAQIFLVGAEFTKVYASNYGSLQGTEAAHSVAQAADEPVPDAVRGPTPAPTRYPDARDPGSRADAAAQRNPSSRGAPARRPAASRDKGKGLVMADPAPMLTRMLAGFFLIKTLSSAARGMRR
jgi:membrane protein